MTCARGYFAEVTAASPGESVRYLTIQATNNRAQLAPPVSDRYLSRIAYALGAYGRMTEADLRSVFQYLRSLPPVEHATGATIQKKG